MAVDGLPRSPTVPPFTRDTRRIPGFTETVTRTLRRHLCWSNGLALSHTVLYAGREHIAAEGGVSYGGYLPFYSGGVPLHETMVARSTGMVAASGEAWVFITRS